MDFLSDTEIAERVEAMERVELFDLGYFDAEPEQEPDTWPTLTSQQLANEYSDALHNPDDWTPSPEHWS